MEFINTEFEQVYLVKTNKFKDIRGEFYRIYCEEEFEQVGIKTKFVQQNISVNYKKGTIRGMHYQYEPYGETKLVQCIKGKVFDVVIDIRKNSKTYGLWNGFILDEEDVTGIYIPKGFAHGYQTLTDNTILNYNMGEFYKSEYNVGINYKSFSIEWPDKNIIISQKDDNLPIINE